MAERQEILSAQQIQLFKPEDPQLRLIGESAKKAVAEILTRQLGIKRISCVIYDYRLDTDYVEFEGCPQQLFWLERSDINQLLRGNRLEALSMFLDRKKDTDTLLVPAISSLVVSQERLAQIPQMDFVGRVFGKEDLKERVKYFLSQGEWVVVDSGASYHTWRIDSLMTLGEWREFMEKVKFLGERHYESDSLIPDIGFIEHSLKRGFSALRVHEIPLADIIEEPPPQIVGHMTSGF